MCFFFFNSYKLVVQWPYITEISHFDISFSRMENTDLRVTYGFCCLKYKLISKK